MPVFLHISDIFITFVSMNQQVTDISESLRKMAGEMQLMRKTIDSQHARICQLNRNIEKLNKELHQKDREIEDLRKRLSRYENPDKNSTNSSTPPTKEKMKDEIIRRTKSLRKRSGLKPGGQKDHDGHRRNMVESPDFIEEHSSRYCKECGRSLDDIKGHLIYTTQEIDLPAVITPTVTEHRHYEKVCPCGCHNHGYAPRKRGGSPVTFGKTIRSIVTYLNVVQCIPYERLQTIMKELFSLSMSQGTIKNIVDDAMEKSRPVIRLLEDTIRKSRVVGFDESGCYNQKRLDWAWIAQTAYVTLCFRAGGRAARVLEDRFGDSLKNMVAVTDRHSAYFAIDFLGHQICLAHILRELEYLSELDKDQKWSGQLQQLLRDAIHQRNTRPGEIIPKGAWLTRLDRLLAQSLTHLNDNFEKLGKGLVKARDYIFNFLEDPAIPPDNNASERGIRKLKVKQKISGTFRSDSGADDFFAIHSIADTAWKNNQSQYNAIATILSL